MRVGCTVTSLFSIQEPAPSRDGTRVVPADVAVGADIRERDFRRRIDELLPLGDEKPLGGTARPLWLRNVIEQLPHRLAPRVKPQHHAISKIVIAPYVDVGPRRILGNSGPGRL